MGKDEELAGSTAGNALIYESWQIYIVYVMNFFNMVLILGKITIVSLLVWYKPEEKRLGIEQFFHMVYLYPEHDDRVLIEVEGVFDVITLILEFAAFFFFHYFPKVFY